MNIINKKILFQFMRDKHPITFKRWMLDEQKWRDGKSVKYFNGVELKFGDEWTPLNDQDFKGDCERFGIQV